MLELTPAISATLAIVGALAGLLGAMVGVGGGVLLVPALALGFGLELHVAVATSLVAVIATSTGAGSVYVGKGLANMRLGMSLEVATTLGGIFGGLIGAMISASTLAGFFGVVTGVTAGLMLRRKHDVKAKSATDAKPAAKTDADEPMAVEHGWEEVGRLAGAYYDDKARSIVTYEVVRLWAGVLVSLLAGALSGMLGVGGGFLKVPAMTIAMRVPLRVAAATSNVMIGVTAIASLGLYFARGFVHPTLAAPVALGVVAGSLLGTKLASKVPTMALRWTLFVLLMIVAVEMALRAKGIHVV